MASLLIPAGTLRQRQRGLLHDVQAAAVVPELVAAGRQAAGGGVGAK